MKKVLKLIAWFPLVAILVFFSGCETDPCATVTCYYGGTCEEGNCDCTGTGYEGSDCSTALNLKFEGTWTMTETCTDNTNDSYQVTISKDISTATGLKINGLMGQTGFIADGWIDDQGGLDFSIMKTQIIFEEYEGSGSLSADGSTITINYRVYDQGSSTAKYTCSGTMAR